MQQFEVTKLVIFLSFADAEVLEDVAQDLIGGDVTGDG